MAAPKDTIWKIEPHTIAKHEILRRYLGAWFPILGKYHDRIVYIDGFCGPGRYEGGEDGSPIIALKEAIKQDRLQKNKPLFLFIDERVDRIEQLENELQHMTIPNNFEIQAISNTFEDQFQSILEQFESNENQIPTFAFVDPFGFKGIPFDLVQKLLEKPRTEVFINIMMDFINRFLEHRDDMTKQHIVDLFGTPKVLETAYDPENRIEKLRLLYQEQLKKHAKFVRYFEMRNKNNRPIYYLFFATNNRLGHQKMKEAFWSIDTSSGLRFSDATNPNQPVLFDLKEHPKLAKKLQHHFADQTLTVGEIREYVEDETSFLASHMKDALSLLEENNEICVEKFKMNKKKRIGVTFPDDVVVTFERQLKQQTLI